MSIITTFENQCRALTSTTSPDEDASRFLVGTLSPNGNNLLYIFEYKDDNNNLAKVSFKFPYGEIWHLSTSSRNPDLFAAVLGNRGKLGVGVFRLPEEAKNSIEDDYGLSESPIKDTFQPISEGKNLVRQSHWHPDTGSQLLTCDDGEMTIWDVDQQEETRRFSLTRAAEKCPDQKTSSVCDLRWSSLFDCSVVAAAMGSRIYGIDTRIPDSSPASVCWLIKNERCNRVRSMDFNPNSQYHIASGGDDCGAYFWDLRMTSKAALHLQAHTHWIWSIRYNPFHDQLVLSAGSDARVALMCAQKVASDPYGQVSDDEEDAENDDDGNEDIIIPEQGSKKDKNLLGDDVISVYEDHDDSVYVAEWATDPWIFASLGFESRLAICKVPKAAKFSILF